MDYVLAPSSVWGAVYKARGSGIVRAKAVLAKRKVAQKQQCVHLAPTMICYSLQRELDIL